MFIAGMDGYLGWSLAQHLAARGHEVAGVDALLRRAWVEEMGSVSAIPIAPVEDRFRPSAHQYRPGYPVLERRPARLRPGRADFSGVRAGGQSSTSANARQPRTR